jgi:2-(1,2-epoxy-1,2-dihydrophenyl)acetyl-CoA isomerase
MTEPANDSVLVDRDGPIATLTLNRPSSLNTLDLTMVDALVAHSTQLAADDRLRCIVVRGAGAHFMAGGDIKSFSEELGTPMAERQVQFTQIVRRVHAAIENLQRMPHVVIASVHGSVAGFGMSLMCACDLPIAADTAYFASAYRHIGLTPDGGASYTLPRLVGLKKAMEIMLLAERFDAQEAFRLGLINRVVVAADLKSVTAAIAAAIATGPAMAMRNIKRLLNQSWSQSLSAQLESEAISFGACAASDDFAEGIRAFVEKRLPRFGGT